LSSSSIGQKVVQTPVTLTLEKGQDKIQVVCQKSCYQDGVGVIASHVEAMTAGNVIIGGPIGLGVDAVSGAMNRYSSLFAITSSSWCRSPAVRRAAERRCRICAPCRRALRVTLDG
jgi:hypothetical protein